MANDKKNYWLLLLLLIPIFHKRNKIIVEEPTREKSADADYLVQTDAGVTLYNIEKKPTNIRITNVAYLDGYESLEMPQWIIVLYGNTFYYVKKPQFKIIG